MWNQGSPIIVGAVLMMTIWLYVWWRSVVRPANALARAPAVREGIQERAMTRNARRASRAR